MNEHWLEWDEDDEDDVSTAVYLAGIVVAGVMWVVARARRVR